MLNKTLRSVLSLTLVFCLLLGMSGNAIALAVGNPASNAIEQVDKEVNKIIADLETMIAELQAEVDLQQTNYNNAVTALNAGKVQLATGEALLAENWPKLNDAKKQLQIAAGQLAEGDVALQKLEQQLTDKAAEWQIARDDLDAADVTLTGYENQLAAAKIDLATAENDYETAIENAMTNFGLTRAEAEAYLAETSEKAQLDDAKAQVADADAKVTQARADWNYYDDILDQAEIDLENANNMLVQGQGEVANAKTQHASLTLQVAELEAKFVEYDAAIKAGRAAVEVAEGKDGEEGALAKADRALKLANTALDNANTALANVKATYQILHDAVSDPTVSVDFVRKTVSDLETQINTTWESALTLQTSLHDLIDAYEELEGIKIDEIKVDAFDFKGITVDISISKYEYKEYKFSGYSVYRYIAPKYIQGIDFAGFTAPEMDERLIKASETLDNVIAKVNTLNAAMATYVAAAKKILAKTLDVTEEALGIAYRGLKELTSGEFEAKVYAWLYNNPDKVCALVKEFGVYGLDKVVKYGPYALDLLNNHFDLAVLSMKLTMGGAFLTATLGAKVLGYMGDHIDFLNDYKGKVKAVTAKLYNKFGDEAKALIDVYVDYLELEERYHNATNGAATIHCNSNVVAIGDNAVYTDFGFIPSYVDALYAAMDLEGNADNVLIADDVKAALDSMDAWTDTVAAADLITVGFGNLVAIESMLDVILGETLDADWDALIGTGIDELVNNVIAELEADLVARGMDETTVDMVLEAAEAYAYTYAQLQLSYPNLINKIQAVNADALIVIVGAYNELENISIEINGKMIAIGAYIQPLIYAVNLQSLAEGFLNENVIFVDAPEVETWYELDGNETTDPIVLAGYLADGALLPSDNGYAYIAEQILAALQLDLVGHVPGEAVKENVVAPDCGTAGSYDEVVYCSVCGEELSRTPVEVDALVHDWVEISRVEASCGVAGKIVYECANCGETKEETIDALEHDWVEIDRVEASCGVAGKIVYECANCGETKEETIDALEHNYVPHTALDATCTEEGHKSFICLKCNDVITTKISALGHIYGDIVLEKTDATCTENGIVVATQYCERCGEILFTTSIELDAIGHNYGDWVLHKMPTTEEPGELRRYCVNCGEYESFKLPALNAPDFDFDFSGADALVDLIRELYDVVGDRIFEIVKDATRADYTIFHDSLYVAIGDGTAVSGSYVDELASLLEMSHMMQNLAQDGLTVADAIDLVGANADVIADADLITLGFSNIPATMDMIAALEGKYTADWSDASETVAIAVERALAKLEQQLVAEGYDEESVRMILNGANAYAYAYISRCMLYPSLVNAVRDVNEDALIVIVGAYNDLEGVVVNVKGREVNIADYTKYLIYAANLENLVQAIQGEDLIYVHAPAVETLFEEAEHEDLNELGLALSILNGELMPSEAGHKYIAQQIFNALNVEYAIWGDVNGDRMVDCRDAQMILRYQVGMVSMDEMNTKWADVNGDDKIDGMDARLILRLVVGMIDHFPVCRFFSE